MSGSLLDWRSPLDSLPRQSTRGKQADPYAMSADGKFDWGKFSTPENLMAAYRRLDWHGGHAPGIDDITFDDLSPSEAYAGLRAVCDVLREGAYRPRPYRIVKWEKPNGKYRTLSIPTILDSTVAKALQLAMQPYFVVIYCDLFKSPWAIMAEIEREIRKTGHMTLLTADIVDCFPNIHIDHVLEAHREYIQNPFLLRTIEQVVRGHDGLTHTRGLAQGCPLSPLAADITLRNMVQMITEDLKDHPSTHWRYADNYILLCPDAHEGNRALATLQETLKRHGLTLKKTGQQDLNDPKAKSAAILGLTPAWEDQLRWLIPDALWKRLGDKFDDCWEYPNHHDKCRETLEGFLSILGPALVTADIGEIVKKARKLAQQRSLQPPTAGHLIPIGEKAAQRWKDFRQDVPQGSICQEALIEIPVSAAAHTPPW